MHMRIHSHTRICMPYTRPHANIRTYTDMSGLESVDEDHLSGEDEARREGLAAGGEAEAEAGILEGGQEYDTLGEFIHAGAAGARRKLLAWKVRSILKG